MLLAPLGFFAAMLAVPGADVIFKSVTFHLIVVSAIAGCALAVAVYAGIAAVRVGRGAVVLIALGCVTIGVLMLAHGLTTPGVLGRPRNQWVGRFPTLAVAGFAIFLVLAAAPNEGRLSRVVARAPAPSIAVFTLALLSFCTTVVVDPGVAWGHRALAHELGARQVLGLATAVVLVLAGRRYWRRWRLGHDRVQFSLATAAWFSACAVLSLQLGRAWRLSWWDYHAYLLAGFGAAVWAIAQEYRRVGSVPTAMERIAITDPFEHISRGYTESLRPLVAAVEAKDAYTHGHSARVGEMAARLGLRMGLPADTVRTVAEGGYLHDIGKIGVPDAILNKVGALSDEERERVQEHSVRGHEIVSHARSLRHTLTVVRHHHERWDGRGYPDNLLGTEIPLPARLVAVADVWDALTSERAYRTAWSEKEALAHIVAGRGSHFDPDCVDAFVVLMRDRGLWLPSEDGDLAAVALAGELCHHQVVV